MKTASIFNTDEEVEATLSTPRRADYICPVCNQPVRLVRCFVRTPHFSHYSGEEDCERRTGRGNNSENTNTQPREHAGFMAWKRSLESIPISMLPESALEYCPLPEEFEFLWSSKEDLFDFVQETREKGNRFVDWPENIDSQRVSMPFDRPDVYIRLQRRTSLTLTLYEEGEDVISLMPGNLPDLAFHDSRAAQSGWYHRLQRSQFAIAVYDSFCKSYLCKTQAIPGDQIAWLGSTQAWKSQANILEECIDLSDPESNFACTLDVPFEHRPLTGLPQGWILLTKTVRVPRNGHYPDWLLDAPCRLIGGLAWQHGAYLPGAAPSVVTSVSNPCWLVFRNGDGISDIMSATQDVLTGESFGEPGRYVVGILGHPSCLSFFVGEPPCSLPKRGCKSHGWQWAGGFGWPTICDVPEFMHLAGVLPVKEPPAIESTKETVESATSWLAGFRRRRIPSVNSARSAFSIQGGKLARHLLLSVRGRK